MTDKKFFISTISFSLGLLALIAITIAVIDPFVHYHAPFFGLAPVETDERGQQIGVARHVDYDTAIIGSSMSENFNPSWFNDGVIGNKTVKLCMQGAHFDDFSRLLNAALARDTTKTIIYSLDNYVLLNVPEEYPTTIPEYIENDKFTDDVYYLWNKSVTLYYLPLFILNNIRDDFSADNAYVWVDNYAFGKSYMQATYTPFRLLYKQDEEPDGTYLPLADQFTDAMTAYIESRPDVEFIFYAPPYSILYWDDCYLRGRLTAEICALDVVYEKLLAYPNVRVFFFQDDWDVTSNLDNYKDYSHYTQDINHYIYECMRTGKNELTKDNCYDVLLKFYEDAQNYYYDGAFH